MDDVKREMIVIAKSDKARFLVAFQGRDGKSSESHFFSAAQALSCIVDRLAQDIADLEYKLDLEKLEKEESKKDE